MLNITSATASAGSNSADTGSTAINVAKTSAAVAVTRIDAAQAATRPLAGTGAGAFMCDGARISFRTRESAALGWFQVRRPRPRLADAAGSGCGLAGTGLGHASAGIAGLGAKAGLHGVTSVMASPVYAQGISIRQFDNSKQVNQETRSNPVTPGGVGPHPAREPDPV